MEPVGPGPAPLKSGARRTGAAPRVADAVDHVPVPRHGSYRGLGASGFHRLHYCDWGRRDNPRVVVCVHGYRRHSRDFDVLARELSANHRVICPDLGGRGKTDWLGSATESTFPQLLADLTALLSRIDVDDVDWIGTSLGGVLGLYLAAQSGTPIRRLVMNDVDALIGSGSLQPVGGQQCPSLPEVHLEDLWNSVSCPKLLIPAEDATGLTQTSSMTQSQIECIGQFLSEEATPRRQRMGTCRPPELSLASGFA
jgi:pimeloyl-ACP methyl ester carboxylesterase